jgi:hypothetical protein
VVNLSDNMEVGLIHAPWEDLRRRTWKLTDPTQNVSYIRGGDLVDGLFVELAAWGWHVFHLAVWTDDAGDGSRKTRSLKHLFG